MLVKSPFGRHYTDIAEKLEQSLYCFGGDGDSGSGSDAPAGSQEAAMDAEIDAISAEFDAMSQAYDAGESFTSGGVTTEGSDRAVRESATEPGKTYNFNIDRSADYTMVDGVRVYDTLDPMMQEIYAAEGQFQKLDDYLTQNKTTVVTEEGEILSEGEWQDRDLNLAASTFDALDAAYEKYPDRLSILTEQYGLLVDDPNGFRSIMTEDVGPFFANTILGQLGGTLSATLAFDVLGMPVNPYAANAVYYGGKAAGKGSLFGKSTISANSWVDPLTDEHVVEQMLTIGGNTIDRRFTTESQFQQMAEQEAALKEQYDSGNAVGNANALVEAKTGVTGTRKPSWRDYVNDDISWENEIFNAVTSGSTFQGLDEATRDGIVLVKNLSDGQDPLTALIGVYGDDVAEQLNLQGLANDAIDEVFNPETAEWLKSNHDLAKLGADIVVYGKDPSAAIVDRYGSKILDYLNADTPNLRAAGQAGLNFGVALDQGVPLDQALPRAVVDYFEQGGTVDLATEGGNFLKGVFPEINIDLPDISLPDLGINWKETWDSINANLPEGDFRFANELIPEFGIDGLFDQGFTLEDFNWEAIDTSGMNLGDFNARGYDLADLQEMGVDLPDLNIDIPRLDFELQWAKMTETYPGEKITPDGEMIASLEPDLDFLGDDETPFSRQLLESGKIA